MDCSEKEDINELVGVKKEWEEIIKKPNIRNAINDIRLEGGTISKEMIFVIFIYKF